jgi:hypothetical protein
MEEDRYLYIMDRLCQEVSAGKIRCPEPEVLTAALRGLFPEGYFPQGTGIAVHDSTRASYYVDVGTIVLPPNREDVWRLRFILSGFIRD